MPHLLAKYSALVDDDPMVFPLLECLTSVSTSLGTGFAPYVAPIWARCLQMIGVTLQQWSLHCQNPDQYMDVDKDYIVISLDLLSGIAQGMSITVEPFVAQCQTPIMPLLFACLKDVNGEVRQSAYALLGDLTISAFEVIKPGLNEVLPLVIEQIDPNVPSNLSSACNNAAWSSGEIALQWRML
jgi:transportin-1